jgi:hypothetical protein
MIIFYNFDYELEILRGLGPSADASVSRCKEHEPPWPPWETGPTGGSSGPITATAEETGCMSSPSSSYALAEWNGHKHQPIPNTESWVYLVQYNSGAEGWNCTSTDAVVFYSLTYSYRMFEQAHGRIDRLDTPFTDLWYYTLVSSAPLDKAIQRALETKESFNETKWLKSVTSGTPSTP